MGEHGDPGRVTDRVDAFPVGAEMLIDRDCGPIGRHAGRLQAQVTRVGPPAGRHQDLLGLEFAG